MRQGVKVTCLFLACLLLAQGAHAGLFRVESETFSSARNGFYDYKFELPTREFLAGNYENDSRRFIANTNFSLLTDPTHNNPSTANFYTADIRYEVLPDLLGFRAGRSFDTQYSI